MPPLSLLFSSDRETTRLLRQAFYELEFEVEHCPEIFAAVQKLTTRSFDVIVTDFDDGLEANFLLKTSRELKANSGAFTLAITSDRDANAAARKVGADLVLNKPIVTEVAKYSLLTSDAFLRSMKNWLPKLQIASGPKTVSREAKPPRPDAPVVARVSDGMAPAAATRNRRFRDEPFGASVLDTVQSAESFSLLPYVTGERGKHHRRSAVGVLVAAMAMVVLSVGYVFSEQSMVNSVATVCEQALARTESWLSAPEFDSSSSELAQNHDSESPGLRSSSRIRVSEVHDPMEIVQPSTTPAAQFPKMETQTQPAEFSRVNPAPEIPESLRTSSLATVEGPGKAGNSLLAALQPVDLPEDLSTKLILQRVEPSYPAQARQAGLQGLVVMRAWIGKDGKIQDVKLIRGSLLLGEAAYHAVKQWRYRPYLLNGQAVETQTYVTLDFRLP
jgi:TonB family protein